MTVTIHNLHGTMVAPDIQIQRNQDLFPWSVIKTSSCDESCALSNLGEMKNAQGTHAQGTHAQASLWACIENMFCFVFNRGDTIHY